MGLKNASKEEGLIATVLSVEGPIGSLMLYMSCGLVYIIIVAIIMSVCPPLPPCLYTFFNRMSKIVSCSGGDLSSETSDLMILLKTRILKTWDTANGLLKFLIFVIPFLAALTPISGPWNDGRYLKAAAPLLVKFH